ncbi:helix-turn-helix domain-containing protein [Candidatus Xianfuyuplasma coldseepsis]|uniref:Helix-turn-helix transcriptional regulator n=1 Tax=Candidatus Xianfuyuplasma coldseepsis TaxID=2782163 RepID=A0A7L7KRQ4_9MOLU|nr:helix-turn-helix transcriptional regulator [Xianfuyuplasma coldseepsis]QMS85501.1 helix-turn-helix transcriptional regulator [Xianfuyuplasma coldseepsis]
MNINLQIHKKHSQVILGITLRYARLKANLSLRDLSELANISHTFIANIETGKVVANSETLRDLFAILHIEYRDDETLISEFTERYNRVFNNLYMDRLERTLDDISILEAEEEKYLNSIVIIDYSLLRFLHAAISDSMTSYLRQNLDLLKRVSSLLSEEQQQVKFLIFGIDAYNHGDYKRGYEMLLQARKIGNASIDPLINDYVIRCEVKMFMFMDAQQLADQTIDELEADINYMRAMKVRLSIAYSHMLLHKYDAVDLYLDKVCHYGTEFNELSLLDQCHSIRAVSYLLQKRYQDVERTVNLVVHDNPISLIVKMDVAAYQGNIDRVREMYQHAMQDVILVHHKRDQMFFTLVAHTLQAYVLEETVYVAKLEELIDFTKAHMDLELLMFAYDLLIVYYRQSRHYKQALELSEQARGIRSFGQLNS